MEWKCHLQSPCAQSDWLIIFPLSALYSFLFLSLCIHIPVVIDQRYYPLLSPILPLHLSPHTHTSACSDWSTLPPPQHMYSDWSTLPPPLPTAGRTPNLDCLCGHAALRRPIDGGLEVLPNQVDGAVFSCAPVSRGSVHHPPVHRGMPRVHRDRWPRADPPLGEEPDD